MTRRFPPVGYRGGVGGPVLLSKPSCLVLDEWRSPAVVVFPWASRPEEAAWITLTLQEEEEEPRSKQIKTCRELVLLYPDILASPALDSLTDITVVMAVPFFQRGIIQVFGQRHHLQLSSPQCVFPGVLQCCLSYSLITRLAPSWNKAGLYLISGKDFLTEGTKLSAVSMEVNTRKNQLCISIEANTVRLPPTTLEDFNLPPLVLSRFCSDPTSVLNPSSTGGAMWCHVLPSMKKGQIITISRQLPVDGPFRTYRDLQSHWDCLYGYRLPELADEELVYCSIYFRPVGERLFTYPLSCIRLQPVQRCPRVDLQGVLSSFLSDLREMVQSVCGFPAQLTSKPCYHTASLCTAASPQVLSSEQVNLTASSFLRPVLPPPPPPPPPTKPSFGSQPPASGCGSSLTTSQGCGDVQAWPSSSSSFSLFPSSQTLTPSLSSSSSSSSFSLLEPASSLPDSFSSALFPHSPSQTLVNPPTKLVPIFTNKNPLHHLNVALLREQRQREQLNRGVEGRRVTLPSFGKNGPATAPSPPSSLQCLLNPPMPIVPRLSHCPKKTHSSTTPQPSAHPNVKHISSLSPASKAKPRIIITPKPEGRELCLSPSPRNPEVPYQMWMWRKWLEATRLNSVTLLSWLRGRGVLVSTKHKKEELMLKVMGCINLHMWLLRQLQPTHTIGYYTEESNMNNRMLELVSIVNGELVYGVPGVPPVPPAAPPVQGPRLPETMMENRVPIGE
ncbi:hypothetical protein INR49_029185, partial [Caranx melampygus]